MTLRISQHVAVCGLFLLLPAVAAAQAPRYQSPLITPEAEITPTLPSPPAITPNGEVVEDIIARVNDKVIDRSDLERSEEQLTQELQQTHASPEEAEERRKNLLRDMIDQQLLLSRGEQLGINPDAEVTHRLDEIRKQYHMDSMEQLQKAAEAQGVSYEDFKANIRNQIITQEVVRDEVGRHIQLSASQEQAYYDKHKEEFAEPEQIQLSEILVPTPADATDAVVNQAKAKADDIEKQLKGGADFAELAKKYSGGPTASQGGDLGEFKRGALAKVLEDQTFDLDAGQFTAPIRTRQGFIILKVTKHTKAGIPALKDVEPQVQQAIYMEQMQPALRTYLTHLRENAYIDVRPGFVDSGASPNETKPVFSAYAPPAPKKKKQEKERFDGRGRMAATKKAPAATPTPAPHTTTNAQLAPITKRKKVKREKVRFGQAPRNALPATDVASGTPADEQQNTNEAAPGQAIAPVYPQNALVAGSDVNPLEAQPRPDKKTRFADRARTEKVKKARVKAAEAREKKLETPPPMTEQEKLAAKVQSAPLGLNGDTATKKKKKRVKGEKKERLQSLPEKPATPLPPPTPARGADRGTPYEGTAGPPPQDTKQPPANTPQ